MEEKKLYYWIKLNTNFFAEDSPMDFLLSQKNGSEYVILYLKLCLATANSDGLFANQIGDIIVPYDVEKIQRDMKYFSIDTIRVALELYKRLGLVYTEENGCLAISNYSQMVGSASASKSAVKKRAYREKLKQQEHERLALGTNMGTVKGTKCPTEYRDKSIEYRDKSIDIREQSLENIDANASVNRVDYQKYIDLFNNTCLSLPKVTKLTDKRKQQIKKRLNTFSDAEILTAFEKVEKSDFCTGRSGSWQASFDWLFVNDANMTKVLEGNYDNKAKDTTGVDAFAKKWGIDEYDREAVLRFGQED